jgi:hypothetical protein
MLHFQPQSNRFIPQFDNQGIFLLMGQRSGVMNQRAERCIGIGHPEIPLAAILCGLFTSFHSSVAEKFSAVPYFLVSAI